MRLLTMALVVWAGVAGAEGFTTLKGHGGPVMGLDVSPEGRVASASFDNSVGLWDGPAPHWFEGHDAAVTAVRFAGRAMVLSGADDFRVLAWDRRTGTPEELTRHAGKVTDIAFDAETGLVASASWDGTIRLSSVGASGAERVLDAPGGVNAVAFAGPERLYAGTSNGLLVRLDPGDGAALPLVRHGFGINRLIVADGWIAYGAVDGGTRVITPEGDEIADFTLDRRPILSMAYHEGSGQLAVGDGHGYIMVVDTGAWKITRDFRAMRRGPVWALAFSPDGGTIYAGGLDDVIYAWPVDLLDAFAPADVPERSFLRDADTMPNGERQFMRKCSICHALEPGPSRKAGPTLHGLFGRRAGTVPGYGYSDTLDGSAIVWNAETIDALFDEGPDHYIPGSKMPMQVIAAQSDRADLIDFLRRSTKGD